MMEFLKYISIIIKKIVRCVKKNENLWDTEFNKVIMSCVILEAEEANAVLKRPYTRTVRLESHGHINGTFPKGAPL